MPRLARRVPRVREINSGCGPRPCGAGPVEEDEGETMDLQDTIRTYRLFSGSYDVVFGPVFHLGRKDAVRIANALPKQEILEVGVGTGLSLPFFRSDSEVTGIDVSAEMLAKAERRVERHGLKNVKALSVMDAEKMDFPDNSFDAVMGMYVASV